MTPNALDTYFPGETCGELWNDLLYFSLTCNSNIVTQYHIIVSIFEAFVIHIRQLLNQYSVEKKLPHDLEDLQICVSLIENSIGAFVTHRLCQLDKQYFDVLRTISRMPYEKAVATGYMVFINGPGNNKINFEEPIPLTETKDVRKMIEISSAELALSVNENGLATGFCKLEKEIMSYIEFCGKDIFNIGYNDSQPFMSVIEGKWSLIRSLEDVNIQIQTLIEQIAAPEARIYIFQLVMKAREQPHGTMVVISENAASESVFLLPRRIKPIRIELDDVKSVAGIDGALLLDPNGNCHAIGVILDGLICKDVDTARGSRYNSAKKYVFMKNIVGKCLIFVMSEDGGINPVDNFGIEGIKLKFTREDLF